MCAASRTGAGPRRRFLPGRNATRVPPIVHSTRRSLVNEEARQFAQGSTAASARPAPLLVDLALQGGGSHGAFTWGVLDRLLEEEWLDIEAVSGTSAGAMNAAVLASGYATGDRQGARDALEAFWKRVSHAAASAPSSARRSI